jgi:VIT1/CCC1 family predicted Fe2+/Mn2+ transporter
LKQRKHQPKKHSELHYSQRTGWLRAAVLGANDGIVSTASLVIGVASAGAGRHEILIAGVAGLVAGAMSMAAGEYVSVSSQADSEKADLARERKELENNPRFEHAELARIYIERGLERELAMQVAKQLMAHDALGAHARDELGISENHVARPIQAALASAASFTAGAALPVMLVALAPMTGLTVTISASSLLLLAVLGVLAAKTGGAGMVAGAARVTFWGALAMGLTAAIGAYFGASV